MVHGILPPDHTKVMLDKPQRENIYIPFCYLIGWKNLNKYYYGVKYAKNTTPEVLWTSYFTSSKYVQNFRKDHGEPDVIQIRKTFKDSKSAIKWEIRVLRSLIKSNKWLNKAVGGGIIYTDEVRNKISKIHRGKVVSESVRQKISFKKSKPFKITCKNQEWIFNHQKEFVNKFNVDPAGFLHQLKVNGSYLFQYVKHNKKHPFEKGDILYFNWL
jgi:hypothetical protein